MAGMNLRLIFAVVSSGCWSAFQHGYNTGVMNAPQEVMTAWIREMLDPKDEKNVVTTVWSIAVSIYCVGGMIGGVLTGVIADRFGRKGGLLLNNVLVFAGAALEGTAKQAGSPEMLIVGRLLIGINNGLNAGLTPMYLAEISPISLRGSIGTVYQLVITITILLSQVLGLASILGTPNNWPWLLSATAIPAAIQCCTLPLCPESPKYLLLNKAQELHAQRALNWLRGDVAVHGEMEEMHQEAEKNKISKKVTLRELFANRTLRQPLLIAMVIMMAQQLSGINAIMFFSTKIFKSAQLSDMHSQYATLVEIRSVYLEPQTKQRQQLLIAMVIMMAHQLSGINAIMFFSTKIFKSAQLSDMHSQYATLALVTRMAQQLSGINAIMFFSTKIFKSAQLSDMHSQYATLGMGAMNVVTTLVSLVLVEKAGRKTLLLIGFTGMMICTVSLCVAMNYTDHEWVSYLCIAMVILFVVMFAVGPGSIPWFLVTELFNQSARPAASSVAVTVNWTANFIVSLSFLPLTELLKSNTFIIFAVLQLLFIVFIYFKVPETKNKTVEEITAMFRQHL